MFRLTRRKYIFTHLREESPIIIKAWSEKRAWDKLERLIVFRLFGKWGITFDPTEVDRILKDVSCEAPR